MQKRFIRPRPASNGMAYVRKTFDPRSKDPFKVSRYRFDIFLECPRCAYLDLRLGVGRVQGPAFTLNNAVDTLFKKEFDIHRVAQTIHPLLARYGLDAKPFDDPRMDEWRDARFRGIKYHDEASNLILSGGIDDVWVKPDGELIIVDYKATAKKEGPSSEDDLYPSYKRQMEIYQWLFRKNGFTVSQTGYFVYANGQSDREAFDGKLEFDVVLIPYKADDAWIPDALVKMRKTLESDAIPKIGKSFNGGECDYCTYREDAGKAFQEAFGAKSKKTGEAAGKKEKTNDEGTSLFG